jgi:hypothetical protein
MLQKQKQSIAFVRQLERIDAGKLNFTIRELIYLYGYPKEIRYSDSCLCSSFHEIDCHKQAMTNDESTIWLNSVNSYFEEFYSQFDILNFSSKWNQKGASLKNIICKDENLKVMHNPEGHNKSRDLANNEKEEEDNNATKKRKYSEINEQSNKSSLSLNKKSSENLISAAGDNEKLKETMAKNKRFSHNRTVGFLN